MKITRMLLLITLTTLLGIGLFAAQDKDDQKAAGKNTTVTGCLAKGDSPSEFYLTAENGKRYEVRSDAVNLSDHVGHKVTLTGSAVKESDRKEKDEGEDEARENTAANLQVSSLQMVSSTCK